MELAKIIGVMLQEEFGFSFEWREIHHISCNGISEHSINFSDE
jgi:hypothetical protein